jgi:hypothetical protein
MFAAGLSQCPELFTANANEASINHIRARPGFDLGVSPARLQLAAEQDTMYLMRSAFSD